ncbi:hypothetical protein BKI52_24485 [marine bacterium AO1-C]|nr:hypothetical protein BKI52_24485 [marine bacterium AO1-C]
MKKAVYLLAVILFFASCSQETTDEPTPQSEAPTLALTTSNTPFNTTTAVKFYQDVSYGADEKNAFDFFAPTSDQPTPLLIYIHGGGFTGGDKRAIYNDQAFINSLLDKGIAFATVNYRLLGENETEGVIKSLNDSKTALQFIRYYASAFNIDKNKVALMGGSAGAGTSLWIGLNNDLADPNATDEIQRESTRVQAIIATNTQSTYDVLSWDTAVFSEYQGQGMSDEFIMDMAGESTFLTFYGLSSVEQINTPETDQYRQRVDMFNVMTSDDPEIYVNNRGPYLFPPSYGSVLHHPLHAKALMDKASERGITCVAVIPQMNIDNSNGESIEAFIVRKIGN